MRLTCPNCGAQYEVPDDVIPESGRDVQCSNCGQTWFVRADQPVEAAAPVRPPEPAPEPAPPPAPPAAEPEPAPIPDPVEAAVEDPAAEAAPQPVPAAPPPPRRELDPEVSRILREEAAREETARAEKARQAAAETFDDQPDLDLDDPPQARPAPVDADTQRGEETRRRMARLKGEHAPPTSAEVTAAAGTRRELLPDIEEINSSLRPGETTAAHPQPATSEEPHERKEREWRRGFRLGFGIVALIFVALAFLYLQSGWIADRVPALADPLAGYVRTVDEARLWLDLQLQGFISDREAS